MKLFLNDVKIGGFITVKVGEDDGERTEIVETKNLGKDVSTIFRKSITKCVDPNPPAIRRGKVVDIINQTMYLDNSIIEDAMNDDNIKSSFYGYITIDSGEETMTLDGEFDPSDINIKYNTGFHPGLFVEVEKYEEPENEA